jgi:branched-chain amino acid transport system ATP-binding protein
VTLLAVDDVHLGYGPSPIVQGVSITVEEGEVVALLGRNGVGKTTLARGLVGLTPISRGHVRVAGADITRLAAHRVAGHGVRIVPQGRGIFPRLSVEENLRIGAFLSQNQRQDPRVRDLLHELFPVLGDRRRQRAGTLSGGEQQMLAIARALLSAPKLLILDEPTEGVAPVIIDRIEDALRLLFAELRLGVLLIEQNLDFAFALAERGYVMEKGQIVLAAPVAELRGAAVEQFLTF